MFVTVDIWSDRLDVVCNRCYNVEISSTSLQPLQGVTHKREDELGQICDEYKIKQKCIL